MGTSPRSHGTFGPALLRLSCYGCVMETVNRYRFTDALFLLIAVLLVSAVLVLQPFSTHVATVVPVVPATVATAPVVPAAPATTDLNACGSRAAQGNWNPNMFEGSQYDSCRAYYPYDNSVVYSPVTGLPVAP